MILQMAFAHDPPHRAPFAEFLPLIIFAFTFLALLPSSTPGAIYFSPSEIDFLFQAPFSRRQLLLYKLAASVPGILFGSVFVSFYLVPHVAPSGAEWFLTWIGVVLMFAMIQLNSMCVALAAQSISLRVYRSFRIAIVVLFVVLAAAGVSQAATFGLERGWLQTLRHIRDYPVIAVLLAPFDVFGRAICAERLYPDFALWGGLALAIDLALLGAVLALDVNFLESAAAFSLKRYRGFQRMARSGGFPADVSKGMRWTPPRPPWLGGAGPIAWRQVVAAIRTSRRLIAMGLGTIGLSAVLLVTMDAHEPGTSTAPALAIGVLVYAAVLGTLFTIAHDVREIEHLKSLPIRPFAIAWGELVDAKMALTILHVFFYVFAAVWYPIYSTYFLIAAVLAMPFNAVLLLINKIVFLIYPVQSTPETVGSMQHMGPHMLMMMIKGFIGFVCYGSAAMVGAIAFAISGESPMTFAVSASAVLVIEIILLNFLIALALKRFDPSVDAPAH
jgi:hypothetical protein